MLVAWLLLCISFAFFGCDCDDVDDKAKASSPDTDDSDDDDNNDDNSGDDDDNDDDVPERKYRVIPTDLDGNPGDEVLLWDIYEEAGQNFTKFSLINLAGQSVYEQAASSLGKYGTAMYSIRDFDREPPAEIIVNYFRIDDDKQSFSSWAMVLRGPDFKPVYEINELDDYQVLTKSSFDLNMDGFPEWVVEKRPMLTGIGEFEIYDIANMQSLLNISAGNGKSLELAGVRGDRLYMSPWPVTGVEGDRFLVSFHTITGDGHVDVYLRNASEPEQTGLLVDQADLIRNAAYSVGLVDHDKDGESDMILLFQEETQARYSFGDHFSGILTGCVSYSPNFAPDLDGDQVMDLVIAGHRCQSPAGETGKLFYRLSTQPGQVTEQTTTGVGELYSFWHPGSGLADIYQANQGAEFGQVLHDDCVTDLLRFVLFAPDSFVNPVWESDDLSVTGDYLGSSAWVDDYTGDGRFDVAMFTAGVDTQVKNTIYYTNVYLFEGPALNQISPFQYTDEYWTLNTPWDFDGDDNADMLMQRTIYNGHQLPKIVLVSPSRGFETLYEVAHPTSKSMGLVGLYR